MSYMRDSIYLWVDDSSRLHLWNFDGNDGWDDSLWACNEEDGSRHPGYENASGVSIPQETMDEYVMMRLAQIVESAQVAETIERAVSKWMGNVGCQALKKQAAALESALANTRPSAETKDSAP